MTYVRIIPRDFFNEANLLKCYGQIYLNLEKMGLEDCLFHTDDGPFDVIQDKADGSTYLLNVHLIVRGRSVPLRRPLNSRDPYPLYAYIGEEDEPIEVFNDDGSFTEDMVHFLRLKDGTR